MILLYMGLASMGGSIEPHRYNPCQLRLPAHVFCLSCILDLGYDITEQIHEAVVWWAWCSILPFSSSLLFNKWNPVAEYMKLVDQTVNSLLMDVALSVSYYCQRLPVDTRV